MEKFYQRISQNIKIDLQLLLNLPDILKETVEKYCEGKNDSEILSSKFADIACGSGAFLLETFQLLNDILIDYYLENDRTKLVQISNNTYKLLFSIKRIINKLYFWS